MEIILLLIRLLLFGVFALAGVGKLMDLEGSEKAVESFGVPEQLAKPIGYGLPVFEIALAVLFLFVSTSWFASVAAVLLIAGFLGGMIYQIAQGNAPDCHCFGQIHSEPVGRSSLIRNGVIGVLALFLAVQGSDAQGASLAQSDSNMATSVLLVLILAAIAVAVFFLKRILEQQGEIMRRIEMLEVISRDGAQVERNEAVPPVEGLPIGAPFPEFSVKTLDGQAIDRQSVFSDNRAKLFFFVSPDCGPCKALFPEIVERQKELGDRLDIVFLTSGTADANREKFGGHDGIDVLLQEKRELAEKLKARWTPAALFVNANGTIGSFVATGDRAIRRLIQDIKETELSNGRPAIAASADAAGRPLKIGESVPEFSLESYRGATVSSENILGRPTLAVFWSSDCPHCKNMRDELAGWEGIRGVDDPNLIILANGDRESIGDLGLESPVLFDEDYEISKQLGMLGTPSAVMIDENGIIVSSPATGAENIWALIGRNVPSK